MTKYDHRLVGRDNLTDLEAAVLELAEDGWEIENLEHGPTISQALDATVKRSRGYGVHLPLGVGMRKPVSEEELERRRLEKDRQEEIARLEKQCEEFRARITELSEARDE